MILFVDDEIRFVENVISDLKALGFAVQFCAGVDKAFEMLQSEGTGVEAIVGDVMMPHGDSFTADETNQNRETGLVFLKRLRKEGIMVPVILLTFVERGEKVAEVAQTFPPCTVIRKRQHLSFEIAHIIKQEIEQWKS